MCPRSVLHELYSWHYFRNYRFSCLFIYILNISKAVKTNGIIYIKIYLSKCTTNALSIFNMCRTRNYVVFIWIFQITKWNMNFNRIISNDHVLAIVFKLIALFQLLYFLQLYKPSLYRVLVRDRYKKYYRFTVLVSAASTIFFFF